MISSLILLCVLPQQEVTTVAADAAISRVTVYDGQALVERKFEISVTEPGPIAVEISPLPLGLDSSSFQTKVISGEVVVQAVEVRTVSGSAIDNSTRDDLRNQLIELRAVRRSKDHDRVAIDTERSTLEAFISAIATGEIPEGLELSLEQMGATAAALDRRLAAYEEEVAELEVRIRELDRLLGQSGKKIRRYKEGRVQLWFERPGTSILTVSYLIGGASWRPTYDVRIAPDLTGITVGLVAHLAQKTGEDWNEAEIVLSTSTPSIGLDPPLLPVRVFSLPLPQTSSSRRPSAKNETVDESRLEGLGYAGGATARLGVGADFDKFREAPEVSIQDLGLTALFQLPEVKTILSDGEPHRFRIREVPLDVQPERYVVPTLSDKAFLRAEATLTGDAPLLPGVAKIFLGPDYLGESKFPVMRPGDSTMIQLGVDPNLSVSWETVVDNRDDPGLLSSTATLTRVYRATLKLSANAPGPILVVMEEAIPLVRSNQLSIATIEIRPAAERSEEQLVLQKEKGLYQWRLELSPGQGQNVYWGYELEFDEDYNPILYSE